jgi:hypothetical protein
MTWKRLRHVGLSWTRAVRHGAEHASRLLELGLALQRNTGKVKIGPMLKDSPSLVLHAWREPEERIGPKAKGERYKAGSILF